MPTESTRVLVVGAGPVGMVCALALNRLGVPVTVLESEPAPVRDQRAASIHPSTLEMLDDLGVTEKIRPHGLVSSTYRFHDRQTGDVVAEFDLGRLADEVRFPYVLQYEQYKLTAAIAAEYADESDFDVRFSHTLTGLTETASGVEAEITSPAGAERLRVAYVVGCDGGRSTVRKLAGIDFEGFTYPERFIKIATSFDLRTVRPELSFRNYFSDPAEWANVFKVRGESPGGLWRVILPIGADEDDATALSPERVEQRLQKFLPKTGPYDVEYRDVYGVNQRVAATFRQGRILLAGDSAHVNNPIGGMGMNGGIHDAINLTEKLAKVIAGAAADDVLDLYSRQRRHAAVNYVQAQTIANKRLLEERDPEVRRQNFDALRRTAENFDTARAYMRRAALFDSLHDAAAVT
ncbi:FAD-dependent monooxygenase [Kribbella sp. NPDC051770]|uniref:FAD-dependent oxidoreductase n=1 Tax=Kribbella sp. NPDC051770 TaxID=3155413 RepID=UPI003438FCC2